MDKRFWGFLIAVAVILVGVLLFNNSNKAGAPNGGTQASLTNHTKGAENGAVKLVEYGDFQCPACAQYYPIVEQVIAKYGNQVTFQFRNFPLIQIHPNAMAAHRAAEAAALQGKYWEMYDQLYQNQLTWGSTSNPLPVFTGYAKELGLDEKKFQEDFKGRAVNDRIQADLAEGNRLGVSSTPTFFIDGKKISNPNASVDAFSKVIEAAIKQKTGKDPVVSEAPAGSTAAPAAETEGPAAPETGAEAPAQ